MKRPRRIHFYVFALTMLLVSCYSYAQNEDINSILNRASLRNSGLDSVINTNVKDRDLKDFIRSIGKLKKINLSVSENITGTITNNFNNTTAKDVFWFLTQEYPITIDLAGSILIFKPLEIKKETKPIKVPLVEYKKENDFLTLDLRRDSLTAVVKEISKKSEKPVIISPDLTGKLVSVYITNRPFEDVLKNLCYSNDLNIEKDIETGFYKISNNNSLADQKSSNGNTKYPRGKKSNLRATNSNQSNLDIKIENDLITVLAKEYDLGTLIETVSDESFKNYYLFDQPKGEIDLYIQAQNYEEFLNHVLKNTEYTYKIQDGIYLIGKKDMKSLRVTELVRMENRTIENVLKVIPEKLKANIEIQEFQELNGFVISGSMVDLNPLKEFLRSIDVVVPVITIEIMIMEVSKNNDIDAGVNAGMSEEGAPAISNGSIAGEGGLNMNLSTNAINNIISGFNSLGLVNIGNVSPNFYLSIQALESHGVLKRRSSPKLATLNGEEASIKVGETTYYSESKTTVSGGVNNVTQQDVIWKPVEANFDIKIKPVVSKDDHITLEISVSQSQFTQQSAPNAPPGKVTRDFQSKIRIKGGNMVILGGLEDETKSNSSSGLPGVAKVKGFGWLFGKTKKSKSKSKLTIFIKPTITY